MNPKKIVASIAAVGALYCGAAYTSGYVGEKDVRAQLELLRAQPQSSNVDIQLLDYRRGVFSSDIRLAVKSREALPNGGRIEVVMDNAVRHGPLLFAGKPAIGAYSATSTFQLETGVPEDDKKIAEIFADGFGTATSVVGYDSNYDLTWVLPAIANKGGAQQFSLGETRATASGNTRDMSGAAELTIGALELTTAAGEQVTMSPTIVKFDVKNAEPGINLIDMDGAIAQLDIRNPAEPPLTMKELTFGQTQSLNGASIDTAIRFGIAKVIGAVQVDDVYYNIDLNGVSKDATRRMAELFKNPPADEAEQPAYFAAQFKQLAPVLLKDGLSLKLAVGGKYGGGASELQWEVRYKAPADGRDVTAIADPFEYMQLADSTLLIKAPAALIPEPLIANYIDTFVVREGSDFVLRATLQNGALTVGKTPIPKEMLAAMLAAMNKEDGPQPGQPAAARRQRRS